MDKPVNAHQILKQLAKRHMGEPFFTGVKNGPSHYSTELRIMDAVAFKISWMHPCIFGYEVKVSRSDFLRDDKWPAYKDTCNRFYFACPDGLIAKEELSPDVGLVYYNREKDTIRTAKQATYRDIETPTAMLLYLIYYKVKPSEYPFHNSREEYFKEWLEHKKSTRNLGYVISSELIKRLTAAENESEDANTKLKRLEDYQQQVGQVKTIMKDAGIKTSYYWIEELQKALTAKYPLGLLNAVHGLQNNLEEVKRLIGMDEKAGG